MTLRSAYFADWKGGPTVLLWGDAIGMRELGAFLRSELPSSALGEFCEAVDGRKIAVKRVSDERDIGMRSTSDGLEWKLRPDWARDFAEKVEVLASAASGHQYLDCCVTDNITVEVSTGEYPESLHPDC
jgi:hypothetical protein